MVRRINLSFCSFILFFIVGAVLCLEKTDLFPFGTNLSDETESFVTDSASTVQLTVPIVLYGEKQSTVHVSPKGIITFGLEPPVTPFEDKPFPLSYAAIAPFYADTDPENQGVITYRESKKQEVLDKANSLIHQYFPDQASFNAQTVLVATWEDIAGRGNPSAWTNTFQLAVANSGEDSFAFFLYPTGKIVWGQSKERPEDESGTFAQAGFMSASGKVTKLDGSGSDYIRGLPNNKDPEASSDGLYVYHIGQVAETSTDPSREGETQGQDQDYATLEEEHGGYVPVTREPIEERHPLDPANLRSTPSTIDFVAGLGANGSQPDQGQSSHGTIQIDSQQHVDVHRAAPLSESSVAVPSQQASPTCRDQTECHADADCQGGCCQCRPQFYGNGKLCIDKNSQNDRMNGQVSGRVNGIEFQDAVIHNFIVVNEGRVYVAYSPIPNEVGPSLQLILPVTTIIGWMFAVPETGLSNGLTITGGIFNHTATVKFESGETIHVSQRFSGLDEHKMLHIILYISGNTPAIPAGQSIEFADHQIEYRRSGPGTIQSSSRHAVQVGDKSYPYTVEESISYTECPNQVENAAKSTRLQVSRVVSLYQEREKASRFGMDGKISLTGQGGADVCQNVDCGPSAACVPQGDKTQCICKPGYQVAPGSDAIAHPLNCIDVDECATRNECSPHAECINTAGSFLCRCTAGYSGDGRLCRTTEESMTEDACANCDANADCVHQNNRQVCRCRPGFVGDGYSCRPAALVHGDCFAQPEMCDNNARCERDPRGQPHCVCFPGYVGDGRACQPQVGPAAQPVQPTNPDSCYYNPAQCDKNAACVPEPQGSGFSCQCLPGFDGDGSVCRARLVTRGGFLVFTQGMSVMKLPLDRSSAERGGQIAIFPGQTAVGVSVDCSDSYIFWSDIAGNTINRARYDGSAIEVVLRNIKSAEGLAIDPFSRNIFWTDSASDHIAVAKLTDVKAGHKVITNKDLSNPRALAIHPSRGIIFWSDWNRIDPKIETANMDGTDRKVLVEKDLGLPNALTVDFTNDDICWADAGNQKVECVSIDGNNRRMIYFGATYPFSMTVHQDRLYWTDWNANNIMSVRKGGGQAETHELPIGSSGKVYGIVAVPEQCPRLTNACAAGNGGCRFICLPMPNGRRRCACPDNMPEDQCTEDPVYRA